MEFADFLARAQVLAPQLDALRQELHRIPELGNFEHKTAALIERELRALGLETERLLDTAIVATLRGAHKGKTAALRAELDALPITEETGAAFVSTHAGQMHACGHDVHMTAALGAAMLLAPLREQLRGSIRFLFEPDEEGSGGAQRLIAAHCLENPTVDAMFGAHVDPSLPFGTLGVHYGKFYAASNPFRVTVHGKSCHAAAPENGIDALYTAARMVTALRALQEELCRRFGKTIISVGTLQGGTAENVVAARASFSGIVRTLGTQARECALREMAALLRGIAAQAGAVVTIDIVDGYSGIVNHARETALVARVGRTLLGAERVKVLTEPTMATEDFGYFLERAGGSFYHLGVGGDFPLHSSHFLPDAAILPTAAALHAAVLYAYLSDDVPPAHAADEKSDFPTQM